MRNNAGPTRGGLIATRPVEMAAFDSLPEIVRAAVRDASFNLACHGFHRRFYGTETPEQLQKIGAYLQGQANLMHRDSVALSFETGAKA